MFNTCQPLILPTKKQEQTPILLETSGQLYWCEFYKKWDNQEAGDIYHHLYILSDDPIWSGDWYVAYDNTICQRYASIPLEGSKKIIATTDESLTIKKFSSGRDFNPEKDYGFKSGVGLYSHLVDVPLPKPSASFIEYYVKSHNIGNPINIFQVEYEEYLDTEFGSINDHVADNGYVVNNIRPLISTKDNTINIRTKIENYSLEEAIELVNSWRKYSGENTIMSAASFENWKRQNLLL